MISPRTVTFLLCAVSCAACAEEPVGFRVAAAETWPIEVYVDFRLVDGQPDWPGRLLDKFGWANSAIQTKNHELDVACPVEIVAASVRVYRIHEGGLGEGGGPIDALRMPHDRLHEPSGQSFEPSRLYLAPGPGWAFSREHENTSYAWLGKWREGSPRGRGGGSEGLIDPWARNGWVVAHELGHLTGAQHRIVRSPEDCSFMSYGKQMFPLLPANELCPNIGRRMLRAQCDGWLSKARAARTPVASPADANRDGRVDAADATALRTILAAGPPATSPPACLGWTSPGACELFPAGDANRDLRVDPLDLESLAGVGVDAPAGDPLPE